jgi:hypothetical protein
VQLNGRAFTEHASGPEVSPGTTNKMNRETKLLGAKHYDKLVNKSLHLIFKKDWGVALYALKRSWDHPQLCPPTNDITTAGKI